MLSKVLITTLALCSFMFGAECTERYGKGSLEIKLATGSPGELGLVKVLAEEFAKSNNITLCWIKAGSGESLSLLKNKDVDLIMVHAPKSEKEAVKEGLAERFEKMAIGDAVKGVVTGVVDFGVFVNVEGIEGLIHISEISWSVSAIHQTTLRLARRLMRRLSLSTRSA